MTITNLKTRLAKLEALDSEEDLDYKVVLIDAGEDRAEVLKRHDMSGDEPYLWIVQVM